MRRVLYITGTRADFGLLENTLQCIHSHPELELGICVTGMHLSEKFGMTIRDIEQSGLSIVEQVDVDIERDGIGEMGRVTGVLLSRLSAILIRYKPDIIMVLGDRGEMLAGAVAGLYANIPVVHIHGGERSGTVDEPIRHAISKIAHFHFVATEDSRKRLLRMGEDGDRIFVTGAPGLDGIEQNAAYKRNDLCHRFQLDPEKETALVVFHPVVQQVEELALQTRVLMDSLLKENLQAICLLPNSDLGTDIIRQEWGKVKVHDSLKVATHLTRDLYLSCVAQLDMMIGNSSSGIIEAATFNTPVVNIGERQEGRIRSGNVIDCQVDLSSISGAIHRARDMKGEVFDNVYGDGTAGEKIVSLLLQLEVSTAVMAKQNSY